MNKSNKTYVYLNWIILVYVGVRVFKLYRSYNVLKMTSKENSEESI